MGKDGGGKLFFILSFYVIGSVKSVQIYWKGKIPETNVFETMLFKKSYTKLKEKIIN